MAVQNYLSTGAIQPNPSGANAASTSYLSPGAIQPNPVSVGGAPFTQLDWPNPRGPVRNDQAINSQTSGLPAVEGILKGQDTLPFRGDFQNPTLMLSRQAAVLAQMLGSPRVLNLLIGQDTFYGAAGEVIDYEWPVPAGPPARHVAINSQPQGFLTTLFGAITQSPFYSRDWPNPRGPIPPQQTQPQGAPLNLTTLVGQDSLPIRQQDWPIPRGSIPPVQAQVNGTNTLLTLLVGKDALPFRQSDWPNPRGPQQPVQTQPLGTLVETLVPPVKPFLQTDWPLPTPAKLVPIAVSSQTNGTATILTLLIGKDTLPFRQLDWANPIPSASRLAALSAQQLGQVISEEEIEVPFSQFDWANPIWPISKTISLIAQPIGSPLNLIPSPGQSALPHNISDWPNPVRQISRISTLNSQPQGIYNFIIPANIILVADTGYYTVTGIAASLITTPAPQPAFNFDDVYDFFNFPESAGIQFVAYNPNTLQMYVQFGSRYKATYAIIYVKVIPINLRRFVNGINAGNPPSQYLSAFTPQ